MEGVRQDFLGAATRLLHAAKPSLSADLYIRHVEMQPSNAKSSDENYQLRCSACGTLSLTDWHFHTRRTGSNRQRIAFRECSVCSRVTKLRGTSQTKLSQPGKTPIAEAVAMPVEKLPDVAKGKPDTAPKMSSKQRAKVRKDREGLQALLDKSRPVPNTTILSLMDFVQR